MVKRPENFDKNARAILKTFNRYQVTEYNTTVARCRTAKQWNAFQSEDRRQALPNLKWIRTRSATPREAHLAYVGLILPKNHPFWLKNQPGNVYGCKCDWVETSNTVTKAIEGDSLVKPSKGIDGNPGITRRLFSDDHTYFKSLPKPDATDVDAYITKQLLAEFVKRKGYAIHPMHTNKAGDLKGLILAAREFDKLGKGAYIMPKLSHADNDLYQYLYKMTGAIEGKMPDLLIGGLLYEFEGYSKPFGRKTLSNMVGSGAKQCERIVIDLRGSGVTQRYATKRIYDFIKEGVTISEAWGIRDSGLVKLL